MENKDAFKATLTVTSENLEDSPFTVRISFDPPQSELDPNELEPTAYRFMHALVERHIMPVIAFNERYLAEIEEDALEESEGMTRH
jgi:hypothetical protein